MADFSLTTLFVVPKGVALATTGYTQDLGAGVVGLFKNDYLAGNAAAVTAATVPYFYIAQGRANTYLQGSKRSNKIKGCTAAAPCNSNVVEAYKVTGCPTAAVQITDVSGFAVNCGDIVTLTLRAHSSYLDTLYFNGFTRSATVQAPCCDCGGDPCAIVDVPALIDKLIAKLREQAPGNNPDNISLNQFFTFERIGNDANAILRISGKALTKYGQPCDVAAFPHEYDRMWFRTFVYEGPATTADFIVADSCNIVANSVVTQRSSYPTGTADEIRQLEKNFYSYQAGYLKHLYRMAGYNGNFESHVVDGGTSPAYTTYYIKFRELNKAEYMWGDYIEEDETVIVAVHNDDAATITEMNALLDALGFGNQNFLNTCISTTTTSSTSSSSTTTSTTTLIP